MVTVKDPLTGEWMPTTKELFGPTALLTTTTKLWLDYEMETRMLEVVADDSPAQTKAVINAQAGEDHTERADIPVAAWHAFYEWLKLGPRSVVVGDWAKVLPDMVDPRAVRLRRDFKRLLGAARVNAFLHQSHRPRNDAGAIVATLDDYAAVYGLIEPTVANSVGKKPSKEIVRVVDWVKGKLGEAARPSKSSVMDEELEKAVNDFVSLDCVETSVREMAEELHLTKSTASRHIHQAIDLGLLENRQERRKARMLLRLGPVAVDHSAALPTPEAIEMALLLS
jgi:hypothetical protein